MALEVTSTIDVMITSCPPHIEGAVYHQMRIFEENPNLVVPSG
jgi:hypothetical protein